MRGFGETVGPAHHCRDRRANTGLLKRFALIVKHPTGISAVRSRMGARDLTAC